MAIIMKRSDFEEGAPPEPEEDFPITRFSPLRAWLSQFPRMSPAIFR
jgi:hypothetical protein